MKVHERGFKSDETSSAIGPGQVQPVPSRGLRALIVVLGIAAWFGTQQLIGAKTLQSLDEASPAGIFLTQNDRLLTPLAPLHAFLLSNPPWADGLLIISSMIINVLAVFLLLHSIFGPSVRPILGLILIFGLRQLLQLLCALPAPEGMIWRNPGVHGGLVTYEVENDLFFSGHTAIAVLGAIELGRLGNRWLVALGIVIAVFEVLTVLVLRAHYTMDVYAGAITAVCMALIADRLAPPCDRALARLTAAPASNKG
jgi:membrane-associated phospholipid phosphatase